MISPAPAPTKEAIIFQRRNRLKQHFVSTSKVLLYGYKMLSDGAKITYQVIDGYDWEDKETGDSKGYVFPAVKTLAAIRGLSSRTIERHIAELESAQLLTRQQRRNLPSILIIEDVSEAEIGDYLRDVQQTPPAPAQPPKATAPVPSQRRPRRQSSRATVAAAVGTTKTTSDKNGVPSQRRETTKMTFAYMDEITRSEEQQQVVAELTKFKIGERKVGELIVRYTLGYLGQKVQLLKWKLEGRQRGQPIVDTAAWLIRAIEEDYLLPDVLHSASQKTRTKVIGFNENEGVYTVLEEPRRYATDC